MRIRLAFLLLLLSAPARAETTLQMDIVVFLQPSWVANRDQASWPLRERPEVPFVLPQEAASQGLLEWLPGESSGIAAEAAKLDAQGYRPLYQASFRFAQTRLSRAQTFAIQEGEPFVVEASSPYVSDADFAGEWADADAGQELEPESLTPLSGWARAWVDTYLFVEFDIAWMIADPARRAEVLEARALDGFYSGQFGPPQPARYDALPMDIWPREAVQMLRIAERKRVRLNEIHYFDHPRLGILVRVSEP